MMLHKILFVGLLFASCAAASAETWVAVGYGGRRMISSDGRTWEITAEWAEKSTAGFAFDNSDGSRLISTVATRRR